MDLVIYLRNVILYTDVFAPASIQHPITAHVTYLYNVLSAIVFAFDATFWYFLKCCYFLL